MWHFMLQQFRPTQNDLDVSTLCLEFVSVVITDLYICRQYELVTVFCFFFFLILFFFHLMLFMQTNPLNSLIWFLCCFFILFFPRFSYFGWGGIINLRSACICLYNVCMKCSLCHHYYQISALCFCPKHHRLL